MNYNFSLSFIKDVMWIKGSGSQTKKQTQHCLVLQCLEGWLLEYLQSGLFDEEIKIYSQIFLVHYQFNWLPIL